MEVVAGTLAGPGTKTSAASSSRRGEPDKEPCVTIIGAPSSAGAHYVGQEAEPAAVRAVGPRGPRPTPLSVGCEHTEDLWDDLAGALSLAHAAASG